MRSRINFKLNQMLSKCARAVMIKHATMARKEWSLFGDSSEEHGSHKVASDSLGQDLSASNLTSTVPSTTSAAFDEDNESRQDYGAIDTDSTDWEDANEEDIEKGRVNEAISFKRIPLRAKSTFQHQSLITLALQSMQQHGHSPQFGRLVPQSICPDVHHESALSSSMGVSPGESDGATMQMRQKPTGTPTESPHDVVRSSTQPTSHPRNCPSEHIVFSPRTVRRNVVITELTEPLRRQILWERAEKTFAANAVFKCRHIYEDVAVLGQFPHRSHATKDSRNACSWDQDFVREACAGYHTRGW